MVSEVFHRLKRVHWFLCLSLWAPMVGLSSAQEPLVDSPLGKAIDFRAGAAGLVGSQELLQTPFTVEVIAKVDSKSGFNILLANEPKASASHWELYTFAKTGLLSVYLPGSGISHIKSTRDVCDGKWHVLAMHYLPDRIRLFVDGQKVADQAVDELAPAEGPTSLALGRLVEGGIGCDGAVDALRIRKGIQPPVKSPADDLVADDATLGLWNFSEFDDAGVLAGDATQGEELVLIPAVAAPKTSQDPQTQTPEKITGHWGEDAIGFRWTEQDSVDGRWQEMDKGPFLFTGLQLGEDVVLKGLVIGLGSEQEGAICYDTATMTPKAMWEGTLVQTHPARYGLIRHPSPGGSLTWTGVPGNAWGGRKVHYDSLWQQEKKCVLRYTVDGVRVEEATDRFGTGAGGQCVRTLEIGDHNQPLEFAIAKNIAGELSQVRRGEWNILRGVAQPGMALAYRVIGEEKPWEIMRGALPGQTDDLIRLQLKPSEQSQQLQIVVAQEKNLLEGEHLLDVEPINFESRRQHGPRLWDAQLESRGTQGEPQLGLRMDTISIPFDNPYRALMFLSGIDFFEDGTAAVCTVHGDVWLVRGLDKSLDRVTWQRYATGLFQPLGLRIVDGHVYVLGKDQITRLEDRNGNGEADLYVNFNNDGEASRGTHDYATCLEIDSQGNFYYARGNTGIERVSSDGTRHEVIATGLRNPNGMGLGPQDIITASPQEGEWTPASNIAVIKEQGHYGYRGPQPGESRPLGYDPPMIWFPRLLDNSSGGQVWLPQEGWGPLNGAMIHLSFGRCWPLLIMPEKVEGDWQAGAIKLPFESRSGLCRGRVQPHTGELYLTGLKGWASASIDDGSLVRLRPVKDQISLPIQQKIVANGVLLTFGEPLDSSSVQDPNNWSAQQWNYRYASDYGSADYKVSIPGQQGHDEVEIASVTLMEDPHQVFVEIPKIQPVMQLAISYRVTNQQQSTLDQTVYMTLHHLGAESIQPGPHAAEMRAADSNRPTRDELDHGLTLRLSQQSIEGGFERDIRINRYAALELDTLPVTSVIQPRSLKAVFEGWLYVDRNQQVDFHGVGAGTAELKVNHQIQSRELLIEEGETGWSRVPLTKGLNWVQLSWDTVNEPTAGFQLMWSSPDFEREPIPSSRWFHDPSYPGLKQAQEQRLARQEFARFQCHRCHQLPEDILTSPQRMVELDFSAPVLSQVGHELNDEWLFQWILNPHSLDRNSEMPRLLDESQAGDRKVASDLVAFLKSRVTSDSASSEAEVLENDKAKLRETGEYLFEEIGCVACHQVYDVEEDDSRISLHHTARKFNRASLKEFLVDPTKNRHSHRMPVFRLDDQEVEALAAFLMSLRTDGDLSPVPDGDPKAGEKAFSNFGCANCHTVDDLELPARWSIPAASLQSGQGCLSAKELSPSESQVLAAIPDFRLGDERRQNLSQWLTRLETLAQDSVEERSERWVQELRCHACHQRDGMGGDLAQILFDESIQGATPERLPDLSWAGNKLHAEWLSRFLTVGPEAPLRPWLRARMPAFPAYGQGLADGWSRQHVPSLRSSAEVSSSELASFGRKLIGPNEGFDCRQCHALGELPATGDQKTQVALGINLFDAVDRLQSDYYQRWMLDPLRIDPLTKMPRYSEDRQTTKLTNVLDGHATQQFDAIWLYLKQLQRSSATEQP